MQRRILFDGLVRVTMALLKELYINISLPRKKKFSTKTKLGIYSSLIKLEVQIGSTLTITYSLIKVTYLQQIVPALLPHYHIVSFQSASVI